MVGNFAGLPEDHVFDLAFGGQTYVMQITYQGGDGNDVVLTVVDPLQNLINFIDILNDEGVLNNGNANALTSKLENALTSLDKGNLTPGVNQLNAFGNQVEALRNSGTLTDEQADDLIEKVDAFVASLLE